ncbi:hypothetical protein O3S80_19425 [Streptomyces sp. Lzd4kr]|nr:hypothetical protein [Streptomyces sp. Lzd4kr]
MSDKNERMKPPTRRTGRALGGVKKTAPPPAPPAAELTAEQFAAEQAAAQGEGRPVVDRPEDRPSIPTLPVETSAHGRSEAPQPPTGATVKGVHSASLAESATSQPAHPVVVPAELETESAGEGGERQVQHESPPDGPAVRPTQPTKPDARNSLSPTLSPSADVAPAAEVAVRSAATALAGGTAFPVKSGGPVPHQEQYVRSEAAPSKGTPWAHGPGRPADIPETAAILNQRIITRESLDSSVPAALNLFHPE